MSEWDFRLMTRQDIPNFMEWRKFVAVREKSEDFILWEYFNGPWGPATSWIAEDKGKIIAQSSAYNWEAIMFGEKVHANTYFDVGVHPDYRMQGLWTAIGRHVKDDLDKRASYIIGFPNNNSVKGSLKLGPALTKVPLWENRKIQQPSSSSSEYNFKKINKFDRDFNGFSEGFQDIYPIYLNRTVDYLNWRYCDKPNINEMNYEYEKYRIEDKRGELISFLVTKLYTSPTEKTLHLIDYMVPIDNILYSEIWKFLVKKAKELNVDKISLYQTKKFDFCKFLFKLGFNSSPTDRFIIINSRIETSIRNKILDKNYHHITMGDHDVF